VLDPIKATQRVEFPRLERWRSGIKRFGEQIAAHQEIKHHRPGAWPLGETAAITSNQPRGGRRRSEQRPATHLMTIKKDSRRTDRQPGQESFQALFRLRNQKEAIHRKAVTRVSTDLVITPTHKKSAQGGGRWRSPSQRRTASSASGLLSLPYRQLNRRMTTAMAARQGQQPARPHLGQRKPTTEAAQGWTDLPDRHGSTTPQRWCAAYRDGVNRRIKVETAQIAVLLE